MKNTFKRSLPQLFPISNACPADSIDDNQTAAHTSAAKSLLIGECESSVPTCLQRFLRDTLGDHWRGSVHQPWITILPPTRDHAFVNSLQRAFPGIPLGTSDRTSVFCSTSGPGLFTLEVGRLTLVCVIGPHNRAADDFALLPLWSSRMPTSGALEWLFAFDVPRSFARSKTCWAGTQSGCVKGSVVSPNASDVGCWFEARPVPESCTGEPTVNLPISSRCTSV